MQIEIITDKEIWDDFVTRQPFYTFMNSWNWGEFNKKMGSKIFRLGFYLDNKLIGAALLIKIEARRGIHLFCPYGPIFDITSSDLTGNNFYSIFENCDSDKYMNLLRRAMPEIVKLAKKENASFIRIHPLLKNKIENYSRLEKELGFKFAPMHVHAEDNWLVDLKKSENDLFREMRKTTRYLIKRAGKEGVRVKKDNSAACIAKFLEMHKNHAKRENGNSYTPFSGKYIRNLFESFPENDINLMFAYLQLYAEKRGESFDEIKEDVEAMLVSIKYGKTTAYYLGASDIKHPKFSPAYLLQWEAIRKAREAGCEFYNFWGIAPDDNPKHPLAGVTLFKKGFGGNECRLIHAHDLQLSCMYWVNWAVESIRRIRRGYYYKNS